MAEKPEACCSGQFVFLASGKEDQNAVQQSRVEGKPWPKDEGESYPSL